MSKMIPVEKNEFYEITIENIGSNGEGIGRIDGYTLFVRGGVVGDVLKIKVIKAKKNFGIAILVDILKASADRIEPPCPVSGPCGGCSLQEVKYEAQVKYKQQVIADSLERIGGIDTNYIESVMEPIMAAENPYYYRNKVQYPVRDNHGKVEIGFYAKRSHRIIETDVCYIQDAYNQQIVKTIREIMISEQISAYNEEKHKGLLRHIVIRSDKKAESFQVIIVINGKRLKKADVFVERLTELEKVESVFVNINREKTNVIFGDHTECLAGPRYLIDDIDGVKYQISPRSFYQVNPEQTEKLYHKALEYAGLTGDEVVYDLYCGIGTISLFLAKQAKEVHGVEIVGAAIEDARQNAEMNHIDNAYFYTGKAEEVMPRLYEEEGIKADVVVVDPPRKGCEQSLLDTIVTMAPEKVVYVSCDPATLSRDVKYMTEHGYEVDKVCGCDMFPQTTHVETCLLLMKK